MYILYQLVEVKKRKRMLYVCQDWDFNRIHSMWKPNRRITKADGEIVVKEAV